jgi:ABC-type dipeptide/oligopeptide/nickel transport system permease component
MSDHASAPPQALLPMLRRRLIVALLTLFGVATVVFLLVRLLPGDPAETMLARAGAGPEAVAALRAELGLDQPVPVQYAAWLGRVARGDLGRSLLNNRPVADLIREQWRATAILAAVAFAWALLAGVPLGIVAARHHGRWPDRLATTVAVLGVAIPIFWSGLLLIHFLSARLGWLPPPAGTPASALLPGAVLGMAAAGPIARVTRVSLLDVLAQPYITAARARGLRWRAVLWRHAARNAAVPVLTVAGLQLGFLLGGAVVTESVFNRPGLGRLLVDGILWRDLPLVQGVALALAATYVLINLVVDLLAGWLDPRQGWH